MEIRIPKTLWQENEAALKKKPFEMDGESFHWHDHLWINLSKYTLSDQRKLADIFGGSELRGANTLVRDISNWIVACESTKGAKKVKCRSVRQALPLLIRFLGQLPRRQVYERVQEGNEGVVLCYFVVSLQYHSRDRDCPEHINIKLAFETFGVVNTKKVTLWPKDVVGLTPHEIMVNSAELLPETPQLREDYEFFAEQYVAWKGLVGIQFLAVGIADDQNIDGNDDEERRWYRSARNSKFRLDHNGSPARVVVDVFRETPNEREERDEKINTWFWKSNYKLNKDEEIELEEEDEEGEGGIITEASLKNIEVPIHPYVAAFDLTRHKRLRIHVGNLTPYKYNTNIADSLILPERHRRLIDTLLEGKGNQFNDVMAGKSGGTIILCQGRPGTGKTLTAEVYSESEERPLYTVQCSQLGTDPDTLEDNLMKVLARGRRWNAVMLLDEADVYVHERGSDLHQNAIVGVFLRVLEYHAGVLFLTTNRSDLVDDAILSRCTARINYTVPSEDDQRKIWSVLARANDILIPPTMIRAIVERFPKLSGRDIKNLLKLAMMSSGEITVDAIADVKEFKPTSEEK